MSKHPAIVVMLAFLGLQGAAIAAPDSEAVKDLGRRLFADKRLSADQSISCATCHVPDKAFADGRDLAHGIGGAIGTRNTPSLLNVREHTIFFWDGRRERLEDQVLDPLTNPAEHGLGSADELVATVKRDRQYREAFAVAFPDAAVDARTIASALASYVRSLDSGPTRLDRYLGGDKSALGERERRGLDLFQHRAQCATCHVIEATRASLTDNKFHSVGVGLSAIAATLADSTTRSVQATAAARERMLTSDPKVAALGRFNVTLKSVDIAKYRTPSLRNVALTAPYMHDGSVATLESAVDAEIYYRSVESQRPIVLTAQERGDLIVFLQALTSESLTAR